MKIMLYIALFLVVFIAIALMGLSISSRKQPPLGLDNGKLRTCPTSPNCVCSEYPDEVSSIKPISYSIAHADAWQGIKEAITENGGQIVLEQNAYLRAHFVTPLLRFVDDVELRHDEQNNLIHIRSASRVGHSDLGANRQRVEKIRQTFQQW